MKRLMIIGLWPDDAVNYCTEKCDCRRYAFDRILYHRGGRAARERICIPVVDRSGATTTYLDLPVTLLEAGVVYLRLDDGSDIFLSNTQMALIANEVERQRAECAGTGLKTLGKWFESGLPTAEDYLEPGDEVDEDLIGYFLDVLPPRTNRAGLLQVGGEISTAKDVNGRCLLGDIQEGQSSPGSGSARGIQRSEVRRNHDGRPETGQRYARLMTICPKECPDRHPGCHDHCERYAENKAAYQKMKQEYDGSVRNPYCRRWTHRAIVRSFKKKFR